MMVAIALVLALQAQEESPAYLFLRYLARHQGATEPRLLPIADAMGRHAETLRVNAR